MKKLIVSLVGVVALAVAAPVGAVEVKVSDPTPTGAFTDSQGNAGYVELDTDEQVIRACNENEATPAGDNASGYVYGSPNGEDVTPTYGNTNIGAGDADGEGVDDGDDTNGTEGDDCP